MTTQALAPSIHVGTYPGIKQAEYTLKISPQYLDNVLTFAGLSEGYVTIRAKEVDSSVFEEVVNGNIDLSSSKTLRISGYPITELEFVMSQTVPFTVTVRQYSYRPAI